MRKLIRTTHNPIHIDWALLIVRIAIACFMLIHGWPKLLKFCSNEEIEFADPIGFGVMLSLTLTVFAEVLCSIFIMLGFTTRLAVIPLIITMLVAAFIVHDGDGFNKKELSLHYLLVYAFLLVTGSGKFSIDHWLHNRAEKKSKE
jgi:putative oxidoreductase